MIRPARFAFVLLLAACSGSVEPPVSDAGVSQPAEFKVLTFNRHYASGGCTMNPGDALDATVTRQSDGSLQLTGSYLSASAPYPTYACPSGSTRWDDVFCASEVGPSTLTHAQQEALERLVRSIRRVLSPERQLETSLDEDRELRFVSSRPMGGAFVLDALWSELGIRDALLRLLEDRRFARPVERLLFALVANRALAPSSKRALEAWVGEDVVIPELERVAVQQLYRAMDALLEAAEVCSLGQISGALYGVGGQYRRNM